MKRIIISVIRFYQRLPLFSHKVCRFYPTCSEYMIIAINEYGVFKGIYLGVFRVIRCNPFSKGGYDPVPINRKRLKYEKDY